MPAFVGGETTPAAEVQEPTLGDATEEMLEPFQKDGPLGLKRESLSLSQLRARSRKALEEFA